LCLLAALLLEAAADPPPMTFQKPCKEPIIKNQLKLTAQKKSCCCCCCCNPFPPLVAAIKAEKQLTPQYQRQHREKRRATSQSQEKTSTQKSLHPRLNTHIA
jgi:hypothetical protein